MICWTGQERVPQHSASRKHMYQAMVGIAVHGAHRGFHLPRRRYLCAMAGTVPWATSAVFYKSWAEDRREAFTSSTAASGRFAQASTMLSSRRSGSRAPAEGGWLGAPEAAGSGRAARTRTPTLYGKPCSPTSYTWLGRWPARSWAAGHVAATAPDLFAQAPRRGHYRRVGRDRARSTAGP